MKIINHNAQSNLCYLVKHIIANNNDTICISIAVLFSLTKSAAGVDRLLIANELEDIIDNQLGADIFWDCQIPKGNGEFLVSGDAYNLHSEDFFGVCIKVGDVSKLLIIDKPGASKVVGFEPYPLNTLWRKLPSDIDFTQKVISIPDEVLPEHFNTAAHDQRLNGFIHGDEKIEIKNMHPSISTISSSLPELRLRLFVMHKNDRGEDGFKEMLVQADTLWLLPNLERGILVYRATYPLVNGVFGDIKYVYSVIEDLKDEAKPIEYYLIQLLKLIKHRAEYSQQSLSSECSSESITKTQVSGESLSLLRRPESIIRKQNSEEEQIIDNFKDICAHDPELEHSLREKIQAIKNIKLQLEQLRQQLMN
jgi:hypothetical protein